MRILPVAQGRSPGEDAAGALPFGDPLGHGGVVGGGVGERLGRQAQALAVLEAALAGRLDHGAVVRRVGDDGDARMVLRGRPHHGRAADVDLLDALLEARARGDGLPERVEVDDDQVEGRDPEVRELADVGRLTPVGEDPGVDGRMQGLDSAVQAFGEAGQSGDLGDRDPGLGDGRGRRAGRYDAASGFVECSRQLFDARLVGDGYDGAAQGYTHGDSLKSPERHPGVRRPLCGAAPRWSVPSDTSRGPSSVQRRPPRGGSGSTAQAPEKAVRTPAYETCVHRRASRVGEGRRTSPEGFPSDRRSTRPGDGAELEDGCDDAPGSPSGDGGSRSRREGSLSRTGKC